MLRGAMQGCSETAQRVQKARSAVNNAKNGVQRKQPPLVTGRSAAQPRTVHSKPREVRRDMFSLLHSVKSSRTSSSSNGLTHCSPELCRRQPDGGLTAQMM